ncbi:matrixin family metalloprotease [Clostridium sp. ZS2-4]|uniref:matrixin family metalloprotease n=1 Tax=Clostridium sp. ZS2-4 TaxID=2987703 RepID=UPI00227B58A0|nr:matrixin family metalloprotease [Clostridium sp. ZS2-4]MCY6355293.1 matrixin family metalloprotease [Clostridium sp. ZS2-4]
MKKIVITMILCGTLVVSASTTVYAKKQHFLLGHYSVDNGKIAYEDKTKYDTELNYAVNKWNELKKVKIQQDTWTTLSDLIVCDTYNSDVEWPARYVHPPILTDEIQINDYYMKGNRITKLEKKCAITHEFGHALGLDHSPKGNIMYKYLQNMANLGSQDIYDYQYLWGK